MAAIVASWPASYAPPTGFTATPPVSVSLPVPVANQGRPSRNWLFCVAFIRQPAGFSTTVSVGDDSGSAGLDPVPGQNFWEPCGNPGGSTSPQGDPVRVMAWYCRNAAAAASVYVAPTGLCTSAEAVVIEVSGLLPFGAAFAGVSAFVASGTSLSIPSGSPGTATFMLAAAAGDAQAPAISGPGAGWTAISSGNVTDGTDTLEDLQYSVAWRQTSTSVTAAWSAGSAMDLAGVVVGVAVSGTPPSGLSRIWPQVQLQAAFGSGAGTPWDQMTWTDLTSRFRSVTTGRGKQYELDTIQAGSHTWLLSNNDGALFPGNPNSAYYPNVEVYTPVRLLATWPPPPFAGGITYVVARGYMERWPQALTAARYQNANAVSVDSWALLTAVQQSIGWSEVLADQPGWLWPCADPVGSLQASNLSPSADSAPLQVVVSKYGSGTAVQAFGGDASALGGLASATGWNQSGVPASGTQGYTLYCASPDLPPVSGGIEIECQAELDASQPSGQLQAIITVKNPHGIMCQLYVVQSSGKVQFDWYDKTTGARNPNAVSNANMLTGTMTHYAIQFGTGTWAVYVNGGQVATAGGSCNLPADPDWWVSFCGSADRVGTGQFFNGTVAMASVCGRPLTQARIAAHFYAALTGLAGQDTASARIERLLQASGAGYPRIIPGSRNSSVSSLVVGASDISGNAVSQNIINASGSDNGLLLSSGAGYLTLISRTGGYNLPQSWTFGEQPAPALNANPFFNGTTAPWTTGNNGTLGLSSAWAQQGTQSASLHGNGSTANPQALTEAIAVTVGQTYGFAPYVNMTASPFAAITVALNWYANSGGTGTPMSVTAGTTVSLTANQPDQPQVTGQAPQGAVSCRAVVQMTGTPASGQVLLFDLAPVTTAYTEQPYGADVAVDYDPSQIANDLTLTQNATPQILTYPFTAITSGSLFTALGSALASGQPVILSGGSLPSGVNAGTTYYVVNPSGDSFQLSASSSGGAITLTASGTGNVSAVIANAGAIVALQDTASIQAFGDQTYQQTVYLYDPALITDLGNWILQTLATPSVRVSRLTIDAGSNAALWPVVLSLETGMVVRVIRRLGGTLVQLDAVMQVMTVAHDVSPGKWLVTISLVPYNGQVLTADDPVRGLLNQQNAIAF